MNMNCLVEKYEMFAVKNQDKGNIQTLCACSAVEDIKHIYECEIYTEIKETYKYFFNGNNKPQINVCKILKQNQIPPSEVRCNQ